MKARKPMMRSFKLTSARDPELVSPRYNTRDFDYFVRLISFAEKDEPQRKARELLERYATIENVLTADKDDLSSLVGERLAFFLKLCGYITSRRSTEPVRFGAEYSPTEIADYLKALFIGDSVERVYLLSFDGEGRFISCDLASSGTVNSSDVLPRRLMEIAVSTGAASVALAHNHPFGSPELSLDDIKLTSQIRLAFAEIGITLDAHYVVAGQSVSYIRPDGQE